MIKSILDKVVNPIYVIAITVVAIILLISTLTLTYTRHSINKELDKLTKEHKELSGELLVCKSSNTLLKNSIDTQNESINKLEKEGREIIRIQEDRLKLYDAQTTNRDKEIAKVVEHKVYKNSCESLESTLIKYRKVRSEND